MPFICSNKEISEKELRKESIYNCIRKKIEFRIKFNSEVRIYYIENSVEHSTKKEVKTNGGWYYMLSWIGRINVVIGTTLVGRTIQS